MGTVWHEKRKEQMRAIIFTMNDQSVGEHFLNRFLKPWLMRAEPKPVYVASLLPGAQRIVAENSHLTLDFVLESEEHRRPLLRRMYSGLNAAIEASRPVVILRANRSPKARRNLLDKFPADYVRTSLTILPFEHLPRKEEGFDYLWVVEPVAETPTTVATYRFVQGGFED
jgi:hypothetical protein